MTGDPLVSVVLPTRDRPRRLADAVASVLAQTYRRLEVLVVDDASSTPADTVLGPLSGRDPRVRVLRHDRPQGAGAARNAALAAARGELVAFLDDDDRWDPPKLERQVAYLHDHPAVGIVTAHHRVAVEGGGAPVVHRGPPRLHAGHLLWFNLPGSFVCGLVRRQAVGSDLHLDPTFPSVEDWDFWLRCSRRTAIGVVPEVLATLTVHGGPRRSARRSEHPGLVAFAARHGQAMTPACRAYHRAHQQMALGQGWGHRARVAAAVAAASGRAGPVLVAEQVARQLGRRRGDPGLVERTVAQLAVDRPARRRGRPRLELAA